MKRTKKQSAQLDLMGLIMGAGGTPLLMAPPERQPEQPTASLAQKQDGAGEELRLYPVSATLAASPVSDPKPARIEERAAPPEPQAQAPGKRKRLRTSDVIDQAGLNAQRIQIQRLVTSGHFDPRKAALESTLKQGAEAVRALDERTRKMGAGWLREGALAFDSLIWGRWDWWMTSLALGYLVEGELPQIELHGEHGASSQGGRAKVLAHLWWCVDQIAQGNRRSALVYVIDWLAWSLGVGGVKECPAPSYVHPMSAAMLYELLPLPLLQLWPADYFGEMLCEFAHGQGKGETAFFPTPLDLCVLMAQMTMGGELTGDELEERKRQSAYDCAVGTGRTLLAASNYCVNLYAQDIDALVLRVTHINLFLYAPWGAMPLAHLSDPTKQEPPAVLLARLMGLVELVWRAEGAHDKEAGGCEAALEESSQAP